MLQHQLKRWGLLYDPEIGSALAARLEGLFEAYVKLDNSIMAANAIEMLLPISSIAESPDLPRLILSRLTNERLISPYVELISRHKFLAENEVLVEKIKERIHDYGVAQAAANIPSLKDLAEATNNPLGNRMSSRHKSYRHQPKDAVSELRNSLVSKGVLTGALKSKIKAFMHKDREIWRVFEVIAEMKMEELQAEALDAAISGLLQRASEIQFEDSSRQHYRHNSAVGAFDLLYMLKIPGADADPRVHSILAKAIHDIDCDSSLHYIIAHNKRLMNAKCIKDALRNKVPSVEEKIRYSWRMFFHQRASLLLNIGCISIWWKNRPIRRAVADLLEAYPYLKDYIEESPELTEAIRADEKRKQK
jgi:hypothetical protein